jgi:cysteine desulfurase
MPYFDHNATTPLAPTARDVWLRANDEHWQNPSSLYRDAAKARIRLDHARARLAEYLGAAEKEIVFTSGATESAHAALAHLAAQAGPGAEIAVNRTEHSAVLSAARRWFGSRIRWINTDRQGVVQWNELEQKARGAAAVVVMAANNETGTIQPWEKIADFCGRIQVPYVCDAAQWLGKLPSGGLGEADWTFGSGHKFGAPKGVGFLKIPVSARAFSTQPGGAQENGHRGGTEDLPSIWAMVEMLAEAEHRKVLFESERVTWRTQFEHQVVRTISGARVIAGETDRLWNTVSLLTPFGASQRWIAKLDKLGFQISNGSACATRKEESSHVIAAMGYSADEAQRVLRISSSWETTLADWMALADALAKVAPELSATETSDVIKV